MSDRPRILVVGGGGREHALCWRIRHDRPAAELFVAPGNGGTGGLAEPVGLAAGDVDGIVAWCREQRPDLVVIGPDDPLAAGIVDALAAAGMRAFGPTAAAARIESSKAFAAEVGAAAGLPLPETHVFDSADAAEAFVRQRDQAFVVKADGLASGKGVVVTERAEATLAAIDRIARRRELGTAGDRIVLQERLAGPELSVFAICDGERHGVIGAARDYKRAGDGDRGPNTGGMGAFAPVPDATPELLADIDARIITPVLAELQRRGSPFRGFLYAGLMLTASGPVVIEFNSRLGDPEAQVMLPRLRFDLVEAMSAAADGRLPDAPGLAPPAGAAVCVVLASGGYPGAYETGKAIHGLPALAGRPDEVLAFHAGTTRVGDGWRTSGGRVLGITGLAASVSEARERAYAGVRQIDFEGAAWRSDIAGSSDPATAAAAA